MEKEYTDTMSEVNFGISFKDRWDVWKTALNRCLEDLSPNIRITSIEEYTEEEDNTKYRPVDYERDRIRIVFEKL